MSPTLNEIKNNVDRMMTTLTSYDKAVYLLNEERKVAIEAVLGKRIEGRKEELLDIYDRYVLPLPISEHVKFWRAMYMEERRLWAKDYFIAILNGLKRESALINLLLLETDHEKFKNIMESNQGSEWKEEIDQGEKYIQMLQARKQDNFKQVEEILSANFWVKFGIEKPEGYIIL